MTVPREIYNFRGGLDQAGNRRGQLSFRGATATATYREKRARRPGRRGEGSLAEKLLY